MGSEDDGESVVAFVGKKKSSKSKKSAEKNLFNFSAFDLIGDEEASRQPSDEEDEPVIEFLGKKKKSKSRKNTGKAVFDHENDDQGLMGKFSPSEEASYSDDDPGITHFDKKKSSTKKSSISFNALESGIAESASTSMTTSGKEADDSMNESPSNKNAVETSKTKKKKSLKSVQEIDEVDKILAELGLGPAEARAAPSNTAAAEEKLQIESEGGLGDEKEAEKDGPAESAAAKKKKKKKEKEKEKKVAAAALEEKHDELKIESNVKVENKKVPKHVREMQVRLAKLKETEEKKRREEEERLRKIEEEHRRQEELERLAEEKKRLKKEREKQKLLKKKQEGKLLTGKQKEDARKLEAMRKQILANAGGFPFSADDAGVGAVKKKPIYQTKKSKPQTQVNGAASAEHVETPDSLDTPHETVSEIDTKEVERAEDELKEVKALISSVSENGLDEEDEDEDWDGKSWDEADLKLLGKTSFIDEEVDSEPEPLMKREVKSTHPTSSESLAPKPIAITATPKSLIDDGKKCNGDINLTKCKLRQKEVVGKEVLQKYSSASERERNLRSPICCIMGHVDTGKTKLLDFIRGTNVQECEAGGITQQIGATYFPIENIQQRTKELKADAKLNVPGLLVIDTPGHESFSNLRSRGSGLCDIAILVVDIMHGLERQTIESLDLLKMRNTEFVVALNKVDRLYGWKTFRNTPIVKAMKQQSKDVQNEFNIRLTQIITEFKNQGLNTELYYKNKDMGETFNIVPTSAISGEGIPDLLLLLVQWTQKTMFEKLTSSNEIQCTVLEVKVAEGHGTTIDVVLVNGILHEGDQIVVCGMQGAIVTTIRALLTPHPMKELRVKGTYLHHKEIKAAQGIKITAQGLEHAIAGTSLYVVGPNDELEDMKESVMEDMRSVMSRIDKSGEGVCVQASTLGSLEALLEYLKSDEVNVPVSRISIGPAHKKDVMKASVMLEKRKEYATILAFDVKVTPEARALADELGVRIFCSDTIYNLVKQFKAYIDNMKEERKRESAEEVVFPCVLKIIPGCIFNKKDPIVLGVDVLEGIAKVSQFLMLLLNIMEENYLLPSELNKDDKKLVGKLEAIFKTRYGINL
ncbi:translation initiation factor [Lithospermum erythrorhizon]|uniref:Eukaryotic translation initiation factor 5B n=1 Tax=Lithospermum erythrorhizon TaxID=34254 RepID=A0AAV3QIA4_LITER